MLKVLIANDDVTPMEFVVSVLESVFEKDRDEAIKIMLEAHHMGRAVCGVYADARARELASHATMLAQEAGHPLQVSLADADTGQPG
jgi:ATP-dependent Clp protease adaptor protein ClpS